MSNNLILEQKKDNIMKIQDRLITLCSGVPHPFNPEGTDLPNRREGLPAIQFLQALSTGHKEGETKRDHWFCTGHFPEGSKKRKNLATGADFISFDFDGIGEHYKKGDPDDIIEGFLNDIESRNIAYTAWTSWSHALLCEEGNSRWRIVLVADRTMTPSEYQIVCDWWIKYFKGHTDNQATHLSTAFGTPLVSKLTGREWIKSFHEGNCFSVDAILDEFKEKHKNVSYGTTKSIEEILEAKKRLSGTYTNKQASGVCSSKMLPADLVLRTLKGNREILDISPDEGYVQSVFSPWREEKNPSAFAWCTESGHIFVKDSGTGEIRRCERRSNHWVGSSPVSHLSSLNSIEDDKCDIKRWVSDILGPLEQGASIYYLIRAGLGAGKTFYLQMESRKFRTVICTIDSVALAKACAKDFALEEYTDLQSTPEKLCTTTHSAHKFEVPCEAENDNIQVGWDLAIQDEIVGIMNAWVSPILKGMGQIAKECTLSHATSGGTSVFMSADFTPELMDLVEDLIKARDPRAKVIRHEIEPIKGQRTIELYKARKWKQQVLLAAKNQKSSDAPILVMSTSNTMPHTLKEEVERVNENLKVLAISGKNSDDPEIKSLLESPNSILEEYDFIIVSPTIKAGFSFDKPVKKVFASYTGGIVARDFCQMLMRARNPEDTTIHAYIKPSKGEWNTQSKYLERLALKKAGVTEEKVDSSMIHFSIDPRTKERKPHDPELLRIWVHFERERRLTENNRIKAFYQKARFHGWDIKENQEDVSDEMKDLLAKSAKKARDTVENERQGKLLKAPKISQEEAERLENAHTRTSQERDSLDRHKMEEFYDEEISKELIEKDKKGKTRRIVRDWEVFHRWQRGDKNAAAIKDYHNTSNKHATEYKHTMLRMAKFDSLIRLGLGCSLEDFEGQKVTKDKILENLGDYLNNKANRQSIQETLGMQCTAKTAENPSKWFLELCKKVGATWESKERRVDGGKVREYTLSLCEIRDLAQAEKKRIDNMIDDMKEEQGPDLSKILNTLKEAI